METKVFGRSFAFDVVKCVVISCSFTMQRDWDKARVYSVTCAPASGADLDAIGDDITSLAEENSMFNKNFVIMQSDARLRVPLLTKLGIRQNDFLAASEESDTIKRYDEKFCSLYEGKTLNVSVCTASISDLTDGKFSMWTPPIEGAKATSIRTIPFVGDPVSAITRAAAQVLADCMESESENGEE